MADWRYVATRFAGDGTETIIADELPLQDVELHDDLSGPGAFTATISPEVARLKADDGNPIFRRWSTGLYAIRDGQVRCGGILATVADDGPKLSLDAVGLTGYALGMPYTGPEYQGVQVDPLDLVRRMWDHIQAQPHGNLGLVVADTTSPLRVGVKSKDVSFTTGSGESVDFTTGPYVLAPYSTTDMAKAIDDLAKAAPFDYHAAHAITGDTITHRLDLGYPGIGRRRHDLRFVVGENILPIPGVTYGTDDMASEVMILGAGDGRSMVIGNWAAPTDALRRVVVLENKTVRSKAAAVRLAEREARRRVEAPVLPEEVVVLNHPNAPLGSYSVGDEVLLQTADGWGDGFAVWSRIVSLATDPATDAVTLTTIRSETVR